MRWLRVLSMSIVVILSAFLMYYVVYLGTQEASQHDRNLRGLGTIAGQIEGRLDGVVTVLENAPYRPGEDGSVPCASVGDEGRQLLCQKSAGRHLKSIPWLDFSGLRALSGPELEEDGLGLGTSYVPTYKRSGFGLHFTSVERWTGDAGVTGGEKHFLKLEAQTTLARAFPRLDHEGLFEELLIVDEAGEVILQRGQRLVRFTGIDDLELEPMNGGGAEGGRKHLKAGRGWSDRHKVVIGGSPYYIYVHRLQLDLHVGDPAGNATRPARWLVAGLVSESRFDSSMHVISSFPLLVLVLTLCLGALIAPVLKLWLLGRQERLRRSDIWLFGLGSVAAIGVLTIIYLDIWDYARIRTHYENELRKVAAQIDRDVKQELNAILCQMTTSAESNRLANALGTDERVAGGLENLDYYPDLSQLILVDSDGRQLVKRTKSEDAKGRLEITPFIDVADREYFRGPHSDEFTTRDFPMECTEGRIEPVSFVLESIRSRNNDQKLAAVGILARQTLDCDVCESDRDAPQCPQCNCTRSGKDCGVIIGTTLFGALRAPVLPAGFGYAIIDAGGQVLFHSQKHRILEENLYAELDNPGKLERAALAPTGDEQGEILGLRYRGRPQRILVRRLEAIDAPWRLVVHREIELAGAVNFNVVTTSLLWFGTGMFFVCVLMGLGLLAYGPDRAIWFWPRDDGRETYWATARSLAALAVAFQLAMIDLRGPDGVLLMICMPALAVAITLLELDRRRDGSAWLIQRLALITLIASACGVVSLMPAASHQLTRLVLAIPLFLIGWRLLPEGRRQRVQQSPLGRSLSGLFTARTPSPERLRAASQRGYFAVLILLVLIIGALPAVVIYWDARDAGLDDLLQIEERGFAHSLAIRAAELSREDMLEDWQDERRRWQGEGSRRPAGVHPASHLGFCDPADDCCQDIAQDTSHASIRYFTRFGPVLIPRNARASEGNQPNAARHRELQRQHWADGDVECAVFRDLPPSAEPVRLSGSHEKLRSKLSGTMYGLLNAIAVIILAAMWRIGRIFSQRLLGMGLAPIPAIEPDETSGTSLLGLHIQVSDRHRERILATARDGWICDLRTQVCARWRDLQARSDESLGMKRIVVDHLEQALIDPLLGRDVLSILERLVYAQGEKQIDLLSAVDPLPLLADRCGEQGGDQAFTTREFERWAQLLSRFDRLRERFEHRALELPEEPADQVAVLREELAWDSELHRAAGLLTGLLGSLSPGQFRQIVWERAAPRHREIWSLCTRQEKRTLLYIAEEGFPSPEGWESVRRLEARGLVVRDPDCRIVSPGFERTIQSSIPLTERMALEEGNEPSTWSIVRTPFLVLLLLVALFLFATQREIFNIGMAAAAGAAVTLPALMRLAGNVWVGKAAGSSTA